MANEYIKRIIKELKEVLDQDSKKPEGCEDLTYSLRDLIEFEVIPALENELDCDPTPQHLYDHSGGEPPVTTAELWMQAHRETHLLHS